MVSASASKIFASSSNPLPSPIPPSGLNDLPYDVVIIGAGIVGAMLARELSRYKLKLALIDKEDQPGLGVTKASLSYIHRNHMNPPGSERAKFCVGSQDRFRALAAELGLPYREADEINIAFDKEQEQQIRTRLDWAFKNGETKFRVISKEEVARLEPRLTRDFTFAVHSEAHGMIHPPEWAFALTENAKANGAEVLLETEVLGLAQAPDGTWLVRTDRGNLRSRYLINAAGLFADEIAWMAGDRDVKLFKTRGTFAIFDSSVSSMLRHLVYVAGLNLSYSQAMGPTMHGNIILGLGWFKEPKDRIDTRVTKEELDCILRMGRQIMPDLPERDLITSFAGIKSTNNLAKPEDFYVGPSGVSPSLIYALICSPGITGSPGITRRIIELLADAGLELQEKADFNPYREKPYRFKDASEEERKEAIARDPACGHLICRCEQVSEAEIIEAVRKGARSIEGVKQITRAGMGRCQGGFCGPWILKIIARELGIPPEAVTRKGKGSEEVIRFDQIGASL
ncbi:L-2-hydroxyglutarate oxidase LhgO [bioreactor metagenome]|jgi:glycerol-3-phosphate dehydrogenase|uniref:L-2-hydroxyglutarate oxidase LhgO n=1 Tax=bioreactor metagenome TaxID=1076179 RepID=A0A644SZA7_9ZZZZ|nr:FAD-dependent oxidoreductase [Treponema sp.]HOI22850.1 FAD-dependent oxidoreductase [Spirochaetales bacterium]